MLNLRFWMSFVFHAIFLGQGNIFFIQPILFQIPSLLDFGGIRQKKKYISMLCCVDKIYTY